MPRNARLSPAVRVGCSGWQYRHWKGDFYPAELPQSRWLDHYASRFDTVEINNTFYRLPEAATFAAWARRVPPGFLYAVKASRYLTHMKKLKDSQAPLERFFSRARRVGTLEEWAEWVGQRQRSGAAIYAYFNNNIGGYAPRGCGSPERNACRADWAG